MTIRRIAALAAFLALAIPSTAAADVRHAFQAELYGLSSAQRTTGATQVNNALNSEAVSEITARQVDPQKVLRGLTMLFVEADFTTAGAGGRIFTTARTWASTRAADATNNRGTLVHSYVRLTTVDDVERTITVRYAESPGWVTSETTVSMDD
jgi:hypothetical protein